MDPQQIFVQNWQRISNNLQLDPLEWQVCNLHVRCLACCSKLSSVNLTDIRRHTRTLIHLSNSERRAQPANPLEESWETCSDRENPFFQEHLIAINTCLQTNRFNTLPQNWNRQDARCMKFGPINSSEIERTFNTYKTMLRDNRLSFTFDNLAMYVVNLANIF
ncbi:hypothetical protein KQX54_011441 [Cotesia glomerata]|uniref:Uncharacterized protein n=1 Tax=Cotesia glomerata TaxID=32391 RepID=A0AAV7IZX3_COTGL|nr:hypothetical protein KQX54_011441 [Cotesia glomerata]